MDPFGDAARVDILHNEVDKILVKCNLWDKTLPTYHSILLKDRR